MRKKKLLKKYKVNIVYNNKYLFKFFFIKPGVKLEYWKNN